jgi:OOP family OmpA-OmpF porin
MRTLRGFLAICIVAAFWVTGSVHAGQWDEAFSVSPLIGYHVFEGDQNVDNQANGGLALGYNITKRWAVELDARYTPTEVDDSGGDLDIWTIGLNALYHFNPNGEFVPYVVGGFGGMTFDAENYHDDEDYMMNWGLGAKYFITKNTALRLDARQVIDFHSDRDYDRDGDSSDTVDFNLIASAGLYWQFGGATPPPPKPMDSDSDGIPDTRDKCPDTPLGTAVDAVGCPPAMKVIDGDDDGDGVLNSRDKCPGTPKGVIVDEFGCPVKYTLQIEFDFDKSEVRPEYHDKLLEAAEFIKKYPDVKFLLAGHTDSIGSEAYNKALSNRRAAAVKKYLVEKFGIAAHLLYPRGYGESRPIATNDTAEGQQLNRRVEVICCVVIPEE